MSNNFNKKFIEICEEEELIGANIVVANENEILEKCSFGYKDYTNKVPSDENTIYRIASISKTVGAIGLMQLVEKGLVDLDEDISTYLGYKVRNPKYPNDVITVKMITLQTSSIQDGYDDENPAYDDIIKGYNGINGTYIDVSLKELLTDTESQYYTPYTYGNYKPGTRFCYSNFGCGIMACIIEKASGELYVDYMENHVFKPLGLDASFKAGRINAKDDIANMYSPGKKDLYEWDKSRFINSKLPIFELGNNFRGPAGGLFINMKDLSVIMRMFLNYGTYNGVTILKKETVEMMYQQEWAGTPSDVNDEYRGKAIQMRVIQGPNGFTYKGHTGGAYGVRSYMFFNLKYKIGGCFITNGFNKNISYSCDNLFAKSIKLWTETHSEYKLSNVLVKENEIVLDDRKIIQKNLFINNNFILGKSLADALNTLAIFNEDKLTYTFNFNNKEVVIEDLIIYRDEFYINLDETLNKLDIPFTKEDNNYKFTF